MEVTTVLELNDHEDGAIGTLVIFKLDGQTFAGFAQRSGNTLILYCRYRITFVHAWQICNSCNNS